MSKTKVHIICNTHWDREHRHGFQETRMMLVELIDSLIEMFDKSPAFHTFVMDGQTVVFEDYLEVKPQNRDKLISLVREGRLQIGPWYTLPDHTSVNPESLVRNLLAGKKTAAEFGGRMDIGFSIFSFGQTGQLPQLYSNFGIDRLIFYKGAPLSQIDRNEFYWKAPDGTRALASRLGDWFRCNFFVYFTVPVILGGDMNRYGQWKTCFSDGRKLTVGADERTSGQFLQELLPDIRIREENIPDAVKGVLDTVRHSHSSTVKVAFDGIDVSKPVGQLPEAIAMANRMCEGETEMVISDLEKYFDEMERDIDLTQLQTLKGEMRYGPIQGVHSETLSSNTGIKQRAAVVEDMLLSQIEPFSTFLTAYGRPYPGYFLEMAWKYIFKVQAHDSIHGAGAREIVDNSYNMLAQASQIADSLAKRMYQDLIVKMDSSMRSPDELMVTVFNPAPYKYSGVVRLKVNVPEKYNSKTISIFDGEDSQLDHYVYDRTSQVLGSVNTENRPKAVFVRRFTVDVFVSGVPPMGYKTLFVKYDVNADPEESPFGEPYYPYHPIVGGDGRLDNGLVKVSVNPDCTVSITDKTTGHHVERTHILRDMGEAGNVWVHIRPSYNPVVMPLAPGAQLRILDNSNLHGTVEICYELDIPASLTQDKKQRSESCVKTEIRTRVTLKKDDPKVYFDTRFENRSCDHKISVCFPTGIAASTSHSDMAFEIKEREIDYATAAPGGVTGPELLRHPMLRFTDISDGDVGMALMTKGIHEFETYDVDGGAAVELTLLRAVTQRFPIHGDVFVDFDEHPSQAAGNQAFEYAVMFHPGDYKTGAVQKESLAYNFGTVAYQHAPGPARGELPLEQYCFASKDNDLVNLHCIKPSEDGKGIVVRLSNPTEKTLTETFTLHTPIKEAFLCRADEEERVPVDHSADRVTVRLDPYKIVTLFLVTGDRSAGSINRSN